MKAFLPYNSLNSLEQHILEQGDYKKYCVTTKLKRSLLKERESVKPTADPL